MRLLYLITLLTGFTVSYCDDLEKYRPLRDQCQRLPSNSECLQLKSKFIELIKKCQLLYTAEQPLTCQVVKDKFCFVFPSSCVQTTTKPKVSSTTKRKLITKKLLKTTTITTTTAATTTTTTKKAMSSTGVTLSNEEFVKVPVDPDQLRTRGEYCIRHGKEKKCQELLTNLKTTYSTCGKKTAEPQPERIDCHSFQTHLCKAFPKFPPCLKKTST